MIKRNEEKNKKFAKFAEALNYRYLRY